MRVLERTTEISSSKELDAALALAGDNLVMLAIESDEDGIGDEEVTRTAITGPSAGFTVKLPTSDDGYIGLHYGYRTTNPFDGIHSIGLNISM